MELRNERDRKVLVVGAAGELGSQICKHLCKRGQGVIAVDDISTGNLSNIEELYTLKNFFFIRSNIADLEIPGGVGTIIYLPNPDRSSATGVLSSNIDGLINCLDYCHDNMSKIIYGSIPTPLSPLDGSQMSNAHYLSRQYGESLVRSAYEKSQLGTIIARIPEVYGPGPVGNRGLIRGYIRSALDTGTITVTKDINSQRSYLHIQDLIAMISESLDLVEVGGFSVVEMFGLDVLTSSELANEISSRIEGQSGGKSATIYRGRKYSHKRAVASVGKSVLKTRPRIKLFDTLDSMIDEEKDKR